MTNQQTFDNALVKSRKDSNFQTRKSRDQPHENKLHVRFFTTCQTNRRVVFLVKILYVVEPEKWDFTDKIRGDILPNYVMICNIPVQKPVFFAYNLANWCRRETEKSPAGFCRPPLHNVLETQ